MLKAQQLIGQALFYAIVACAVGYFSRGPFHAGFAEDAALIKLSFSHGAAHRQACRKLSYQEIIKLKGSERRPSTCARQRVSVRAQLLLDGRTIYDAVLQPTGIWGDGPARTYEKFLVPAGPHTVEARMRDGPREQGFDYENRATLDLRPGQSLAIDFRADTGGFTFR